MVNFFIFHLFLFIKIIFCNSDFSIDEETSFNGLFLRKKSDNEIYIGKENKLRIYNLDSKSYIQKYEDLNLNILWKGNIYPLIIESSDGEIKYIISLKKNSDNIIIIYTLTDNQSNEEEKIIGNKIISLYYFNNNYFFVYYYDTNPINENKYQICSFTNINCLSLDLQNLETGEIPSYPYLFLDFTSTGLNYSILNTNSIINQLLLNGHTSMKGYYHNIQINNNDIITCFLSEVNSNSNKIYCFKVSNSDGSYVIIQQPIEILQNCDYSSFSFYKLNSEKLIIGCFSHNELLLQKLDFSLNKYDLKILNNDINLQLFYSDFIVIEEDRIVSILIKKSNPAEVKYYYIGIDFSFSKKITLLKNEMKTFLDSSYEIQLLSIPSNGRLFRLSEPEIIKNNSTDTGIIENQNYNLDNLIYIAHNPNTKDSFSYLSTTYIEESFDNKIILQYKDVKLKIIICHELCKTCENIGDSDYENCLTCIDGYFNPFIKKKMSSKM